MRVEPQFVDHPKLIRLKRRVGDYAVEGVIRLWGHCQESQRGGTWRGADAEYVEIVTRWTGQPGEFYKALIEVGFLEEVPGAVVVHDWDKMNRKALTAWENGRRVGSTQRRRSGCVRSTETAQGGVGRLTENEVSVGDGLTQRDPKPVSTDKNSTEKSTDKEREREGGGGPFSQESRVRWAAIQKRIKVLEGQPERSRAEVRELARLREELERLEAAQRGVVVS